MKHKVAFIVADFGADTDPFMLHLYAALAGKEQRMISQRTKDALSAAKENGKQLGGLRDHGRELKHAAEERAKALAPVFEELAGTSAREVARILNERNVSTTTGKPWSAMTVIRSTGHAQNSSAAFLDALARITIPTRRSSDMARSTMRA